MCAGVSMLIAYKIQEENNVWRNYSADVLKQFDVQDVYREHWMCLKMSGKKIQIESTRNRYNFEMNSHTKVKIRSIQVDTVV